MGPGDNPMTAMHEYLKELENNDVLSRDGKKLNFEIDRNLRLLLCLLWHPMVFSEGLDDRMRYDNCMRTDLEVG